MEQIDEREIGERFEKIEKEMANAKRSNHIMMAVVLLFILLTLGATAANIGILRISRTINKENGSIKAKGFIVVDDNGQFRASLSALEGEPILRLYDENGEARIAIGVGKEGTAFVMANENNKISAVLSVSKEGSVMRLSDENGKPRIQLAISENDIGLSLFDKNGKCRATLGKTQTTKPDGTVTIHPESSLLLFDPNENVTWKVPL